ncbi:MAG TPA: TonB-dependent receptor [Holophagaceae bacterium]|nr:TonB-dependent receptor [Holophagaceae bacterium]
MGKRHVIFILAAGAVLQAAEDQSPKKAEATVTVTAEATPVEVRKTPNPVRILEAEELARLELRTVADLVAYVEPGAAMSTSPGGQSSAFLNGTLSKNLVILLDGARLNDPTDINPNLGAMSLVGIEKVEVVLGPSSVLYGSDAIGGVIQLRSAKAEEEGFHGVATAGLGSNSLSSGGATFKLRSGSAWLAGGGSAGKEGTGLPDDLLRQAGVFLNLGESFGPVDLVLRYRNAGQTAAVPFAIGYDPNGNPFRLYEPQRETHARQESWGADADWAISKTVDLQNNLGVLEGSTGDPIGPARQQQDRSFRRFQDQLTLTWTPTPIFRFSGRLEGRADRSDAKNFYDPLLPPFGGYLEYKGEGADLAGVLEARVQLMEGLDFVGGVRREASHRDITRVASGDRSRVGSAEATTFKASLNWILNPALRLYAGFGQGFRMPNLIEFSLNAEAESQDGKSYGLDPERSRTVQLGATGGFASGFEYRLEAQRTRISNLLSYVSDFPNFPPTFTDHYVNTGSIQASSLEGAIGWRGGESALFGWDLVLRSQDTRDLDHNTPDERYGQVNTAIVRHPFFSAGVAGFAQWSSFRADLRLDRVGSRYDINDLSYRVISTHKAYHELNAAFAWTVVKSLTLQLKGEHLLQPKQTVREWQSGARNQEGDAALVYGFPAPERRAVLAATWRW